MHEFVLEKQKRVLYLPTHLSNQIRIDHGEMAEWSNAPVLKTGEGHTSGGSNPSFSAQNPVNIWFTGFFIFW